MFRKFILGRRFHKRTKNFRREKRQAVGYSFLVGEPTPNKGDHTQRMRNNVHADLQRRVLATILTAIIGELIRPRTFQHGIRSWGEP